MVATPAAAPPPGPVAGPDRVSAQMLLGNPSGATEASSNRDNYLIRRPQYALAYSDSLRFPRWVSWHLSAADIGDVERGQFQPDPDLPPGFAKVVPSDYTGSGYDRGHNCPSKDRSATRADNDAVFYMTDITPQLHAMNGGPWERLESYCRDLTEQGNELYISCGHGFDGGPRAKPSRLLGRNRVAVPDFGWKVVVVLPARPGDDRARIDARTRVIAVRMPNAEGIASDDWRGYRVPVSEIEKATGLTFFDALPAEVARALKTRVDTEGGSGGASLTSGGSRRRSGPGAAPAPGGGPGKVWVNTRSGVYWRPGTEYYGKTSRGEYMTESEAQKAGFRAAQDPSGGNRRR